MTPATEHNQQSASDDHFFNVALIVESIVVTIIVIAIIGSQIHTVSSYPTRQSVAFGQCAPLATDREQFFAYSDISLAGALTQDEIVADVALDGYRINVRDNRSSPFVNIDTTKIQKTFKTLLNVLRTDAEYVVYLDCLSGIYDEAGAIFPLYIQYISIPHQGVFLAIMTPSKNVQALRHAFLTPLNLDLYPDLAVTRDNVVMSLRLSPFFDALHTHSEPTRQRFGFIPTRPTGVASCFSDFRDEQTLNCVSDVLETPITQITLIPAKDYMIQVDYNVRWIWRDVMRECLSQNNHVISVNILSPIYDYDTYYARMTAIITTDDNAEAQNIVEACVELHNISIDKIRTSHYNNDNHTAIIIHTDK